MTPAKDPWLWFRDMADGGAVRRWHTTRMLHEQTVAAHSWGVAVALLAAGLANQTTMMAALLHDVPESVTGDVPAPAKWKSKVLNLELNTLEAMFFAEHGVLWSFSPLDEAALAWADMYELCWHCCMELTMGNQFAATIYNRAHLRLDKLLEELRNAKATENQCQRVQSLNDNLHGAYLDVCK